MDKTITVINCNDWGWKWVFRGLWRGWGPCLPNLEGRHATCRPLLAWVIVPMCSVLGPIPWGTVHTGGHLKTYLDVSAIRVRTSTQESNLFQLVERARVGGTEMRLSMCESVWLEGWETYGFICTGSWLVRWQKHVYPQSNAYTHTFAHTHITLIPVHILDTTRQIL